MEPAGWSLTGQAGPSAMKKLAKGLVFTGWESAWLTQFAVLLGISLAENHAVGGLCRYEFVNGTILQD